ncbi:GRAM domain-containing protein [Mangrovimonas aestuarii]|uniref:GRAM domain-containing protein n=1 Tax=Mangrovimonas aestuarii TaxID=3018443 RepID=UPI002379357F|nr:GRAM domain-containing protein [Mangrovimonas aestuarii]
MPQVKLKYNLLLTIYYIIVYGILIYLINYFILADDFSSKTIVSIVVQAILFGVFMGFGFPALLKLMKPLFLKSVKAPKLMVGETIIFEDAANYFKNKWNAFGGKLYLTNKRLIFQSHNFNLKKLNKSIDLPEMKDVSEHKTGGIVDNGIRLRFYNDTHADFVVNNREIWVDKLNITTNN